MRAVEATSRPRRRFGCAFGRLGRPAPSSVAACLLGRSIQSSPQPLAHASPAPVTQIQHIRRTTPAQLATWSQVQTNNKVGEQLDARPVAASHHRRCSRPQHTWDACQRLRCPLCAGGAMVRFLLQWRTSTGAAVRHWLVLAAIWRMLHNFAHFFDFRTMRRALQDQPLRAARHRGVAVQLSCEWCPVRSARQRAAALSGSGTTVAHAEGPRRSKCACRPPEYPDESQHLELWHGRPDREAAAPRASASIPCASACCNDCCLTR